MQIFLLASFLPLLGLTSAAPSLPIYRITPRLNNSTAAANGTAAAKTTQLTFTGAGAKFDVNAPVDGSSFQIRTSVLGFTMPPPSPLPPNSFPQKLPMYLDKVSDQATWETASSISVDHIAQAGSASCEFKGVNGAQLAILGANNAATLAPPQTVVSGSCR